MDMTRDNICRGFKTSLVFFSLYFASPPYGAMQRRSRLLGNGKS